MLYHSLNLPVRSVWYWLDCGTEGTTLPTHLPDYFLSENFHPKYKIWFKKSPILEGI